MCSVTSSGVDDPTHVTLYGLLSPFVSFVFQKNALRASVMCSAISSGVDDPTHVTLYGLLSPFVTFVFQKNALRGSVMCSAISSGLDDPTHVTFIFKIYIYGFLASCSNRL